MIPYIDFAALSVALFVIAIYGIVSRRNGVTFIVSAEIIINAALINFVAAAASFGSLDGASYALLILVIAVLETVAIIGMLMAFSRRTGSVSFSALRNFKG